jgi:peptidoglycan-associated lipoprotein
LKLAARSNLMILSKIYKNTLLILAACLVLTACATKKEVATTSNRRSDAK